MSPPIHAFVNAPSPPLPLDEASLDLVLALSVFTHLTIEWSAWLVELHRVDNEQGHGLLLLRKRGVPITPTERPVQLELDAGIHEQVDFETVTRVVLTHLHYDHAGGMSLLPPSLPIVIQRGEWEAGRDAVAIERNYFHPIDYAAVEPQITLVEGDHDLLGDGSVQLMLTPGHTPGHQSVLVDDWLVIGGDVTHFASSLDDKRFPVFADDFAAQAASADRLCALRDRGVVVLPGHDPEVLKPGPVLPELPA
jgi:glyoxylase-like metal-dependent hydrolase (beta-lactamase superfamily II)